MNIYSGITHLCLCFFIFSSIHLISNKIPNKIYKQFKRWANNIVYIYIVFLLIINYIFILIFDNIIELSEIQCVLLCIIIFVISDVLSNIIVNKFNKSKD